MNQQKPIKTVLIDFIICLSLGIFGAHKFREKKIGLGILYLFTGGLFLFGWLYDCIKLYIIIAGATSSLEKASMKDILAENGKKDSVLFSHAKKIALISIVVFFLLLIVIGACTSNGDTDSPSTTDAPPESTVETTLESVTSTTEPTTEPTTNSTTLATTEPTTEPSTEPTTKATTEPPHTHNFSAATCTAPKTCSCGATEGSVADHSWTAATCTAPQKCRTCSAESGSPIGHNYSQGTCLTCGSKDPNYAEITYVLNTHSMKFHRPSCNRLPTDNRKDTTMSREEVIAAGYDPCGICHP